MIKQTICALEYKYSISHAINEIIFIQQLFSINCRTTNGTPEDILYA
jgi:transcriptional regulatory protein LevR